MAFWMAEEREGKRISIGDVGSGPESLRQFGSIDAEVS